MRILVTGGAGFIGSHIVAAFQDAAEVRVLDNLRTGRRANLDGLSCEFIEGSITDERAVRAAVQGVDYVFHAAALVSVPESMEQPMACVEINTIGTLRVLEEAARAGVRKLCFSSSAAVYGDEPPVPTAETATPAPVSPYAVTKLDGEYYCAMYTREGRLDTVCLRYFNVYGPRQDPSSAYAAAVPIFVRGALRGEPLTIYGDGEQTRDFVFVRDVAAANRFFATASNSTGIFNVALGGRLTIRSLAETILQRTGSGSRIEYGSPRKGDVRHSTADVSRAEATGFRPNASLGEGLDQTIRWFRQQKGVHV